VDAVTDDLVSRLRAAIEAKATKARDAGGGEWRIKHYLMTGDDPVYTAEECDADPCEHCVIDSPDIMIYAEGGHDRDQAVHIIDNDPQSVLAMCAAHREVVEGCAEALRQNNAPEVYLLADLVLARLARGYDIQEDS
jgi:Family of unknown function (DUF6221)